MSEASVVLRVDSRDAERSFDRFVQGSERASAAVRPLENGMQARFDSSQAVGGLKNLKSEAQDTYGVLAKIAQASAMLVAGSKSVGFFTSAIKEAASHSEDLAQFEHVFRNVRDEAASMMKTLESDSFGRSSRQAMQLTMGMGSLLKGIGLTDQAAVKLTGEFAKLSVDIGSFMAKDPSAVMDAFQGALMGNTMALRSYGVFLTDVQLKEKMAQQAKEGLVFASEREAKAYAILSEAQRQQSDAIGDFAVESENYRNQVDKLSQGLVDLKKNIGDAFVGPATDAVKSLNSIVDWLKTLDQETVTFAARSAALVGGLVLVKTVVSQGASIYGAYRGAIASATAERGRGIASEQTLASSVDRTAATTRTAIASETSYRSSIEAVTASQISGEAAIVSRTNAIVAQTTAIERQIAAQGALTNATGTTGAATAATTTRTASGSSRNASSLAVPATLAAATRTQQGRVDSLQGEMRVRDSHMSSAVSARDQALRDIERSESRIGRLSSIRQSAIGTQQDVHLNRFSLDRSVSSAANTQNQQAVAKEARAQSLLASEQQKLARARNDLARAEQRIEGISRQRTRGLESLAAAERRTTLLENLRANRQATAGSGFGTFSRNASARALESSARDAAAREAIRASSSSYSSGPSIEYLRSQQLAAARNAVASNPGLVPAGPGIVSRAASGLATTGANVGRNALGYAGAGLASAGRIAGNGITGIASTAASGVRGMAGSAVGMAGTAAVASAVVGLAKGTFDDIYSYATTGTTKTAKQLSHAQGGFEKTSVVFDNYLGYVWRVTGATDALANAINKLDPNFQKLTEEGEKMSAALAASTKRFEEFQSVLPAIEESQKLTDKAQKDFEESNRKREEEFALGDMSDQEKLGVYQKRLVSSNEELTKEESSQKDFEKERDAYAKRIEELNAHRSDLGSQEYQSKVTQMLQSGADQTSVKAFTKGVQARNRQIMEEVAKLGKSYQAADEQVRKSLEKQTQLRDDQVKDRGEARSLQKSVDNDAAKKLAERQKLASEMDDFGFEAALKTLKPSEQGAALQKKLDGLLDDVFKTIGKEGPLTDEETKKAYDTLRDADKLGGRIEQLSSGKSQEPKLPIVQNTTMQAVDSRSITAVELAARQWNKDSGQKKMEKDTSTIAKNTKSIADAISKLSGRSAGNTVTPDDI